MKMTGIAPGMTLAYTLFLSTIERMKNRRNQ